MARIEEIHVLHHSHTDVGYTHDQPVLRDLFRRFIDTAVDQADRHRDEDGPDAFRWTVETTAPLLRWLRESSGERVERFRALESAGKIEVSAMLANVTPLYGAAQTVESLRPVRLLREEFGLDVDHAMNCDVNGQNWPLVDALLDAGVETFTMAINDHYGGAPFDRPTVFRWEGPSGRSVLALNGFHYSMGNRIGIGHDAEALRTEWWPKLERHLEAVDYSLPAVPVQCFHPFGDNAPAWDRLPPFVRSWNDRAEVEDGSVPRLRLSTLDDWWDVVRDSENDLPVYRGDWTDFWNFGAISSAREVAVNRENERRLRTADAMEAGLGALGAGVDDRPPTRRSAPDNRDRAWWATNFFDEHTWGSHTAVSDPDIEDTGSQWNHKANYAYDARSRSLMARRDALAELSRRVERSEVSDGE